MDRQAAYEMAQTRSGGKHAKRYAVVCGVALTAAGLVGAGARWSAGVGATRSGTVRHERTVVTQPITQPHATMGVTDGARIPSRREAAGLNDDRPTATRIPLGDGIGPK